MMSTEKENRPPLTLTLSPRGGEREFKGIFRAAVLALLVWFCLACVATPVAAQNLFSPPGCGAVSPPADHPALAVPVQAGAPPAAGERRLLLVVADRLSYPVLRAHGGPVLQDLLKRGAVGLMNARTAGSGSESGYLTLGAGARAAAGLEGGQAFQHGEVFEGHKAELIFARRTGRPPAGEVFHLQAPALRRRNESLSHTVEPGRLGAIMAGYRKAVAVAGNADAGGPHRGAVLIAMDTAGEVPLGLVGNEVLDSDPLAPFGRRSDLEALARSAAGYLDQAHLVVVDFGDFHRLDQYWTQLDTAHRSALLEETAGRLDTLLERLLPLAGDRTMLILVVPSPPRFLPGGEEALVPFVMTGGGCPGGLAVSDNTRRPGLVSNTDLVALAGAYLVDGAGPGEAPFPMAIAEAPEPLSFLDSFFTRAVRIYRQRPPILKGYVLIVISVVLATFGGLALRLPLALRFAALLEMLLLVPLAGLLLAAWPNFPLPSAFLSGAVLAAATLVLALALDRLQKARGAALFWTVLGLAGAGLILADGLRGAALQQYSFLGHDAIAGSRYYGIGNEYMGALIGTALVGTTALVGLARPAAARAPAPALPPAGTAGGAEPKPPPPLSSSSPPPPSPSPRRPAPPAAFPRAVLAVSLVLYAAILFVFASPRFGANLGGTIAAAVAFSVSAAGIWSALRGKAVRNCLLVAVPAGLGLAALLLWLLNFGPLAAGPPSHLGRFGASLQDRGAAEFWETVSRKASMNWRLVRYSIWSRALVTFLGLLVVLCFYPLGVLRRLCKEQPHLLVGAGAGAAGGVAALLVNDSGVVAAAMILLYTVPPLLTAIVGLAVREKRSPVTVQQE